MGSRRDIKRASTMATRWRRRSLCILVADDPVLAALRDVSGSGAFLETNARPELGREVTLHHPDAGSILGLVTALASDGVRIAFDGGEPAIAFALGAVAADMSSPA